MTDKTLLHTAHIPVRWGDMDSYGHVNNIIYMQYLEEARVAWLELAGVPMSNVPQGPVVLQTQHTYLKPVVHPATVIVELRAGKAGRSSLVVEHRLSTLDDPETLYGEGYCKLVWVDHAGGRSVALPEHVRTLFAVT
ncbi:thioesterase family protein [Ectopseudomonas khazarica]|uniref:acyl-CoA thioesterase n=1 Tax=Ectopseudomonas khazarica TaxID=2502979 RepID=UPI0032B14D2C|tara:strand:- start:256 stop:666 length:411 start_codon:yes stop_codon:yes gene_type:complete